MYPVTGVIIYCKRYGPFGKSAYKNQVLLLLLLVQHWAGAYGGVRGFKHPLWLQVCWFFFRFVSFLLCLPVREVGHVQGHSYLVSGKIGWISPSFWKKRMDSPPPPPRNPITCNPLFQNIPWENPAYATGIEYFWLSYATLCNIGCWVNNRFDKSHPLLLSGESLCHWARKVH